MNNGNGGQSRDRVLYSIPGILHFIQHEWARFETERSQWEVERAELLARIAFLQGERKGQENLKNDLVRRIKMLEYALKQERSKYHKLKYGTELTMDAVKPPTFDDRNRDADQVDGETVLNNSNVTWRQGRQLLRQYLQEIGYTDTIIDVRSSRVRSLLGLGGVSEGDENHGNEGGAVLNGEQQTVKRASETQGRRIPGKKIPMSLAEGTLMDSEAFVLKTFEFLGSENADMDEEDDNLSDDMEEGSADDDEADECLETKRLQPKAGENLDGSSMPADAETEEVLSEFDFLGPDNGEGGCETRMSLEWSTMRSPINFGMGQRRPLVCRLHKDENSALDVSLGLDELATITVNNDSEVGYDVTSNKEAYRKTWTAKYTLRSHFDGVRALAFHPVEPVLITASEDHTLKLWNLQKTVPAKKAASLDVEPVYTFRGHVGPVLCLMMSPTGDQCYSGGLDSAVCCWNLPSSSIDPYDAYEPAVLAATLTDHSDAVWGLSVHANRQLLSCSADGTVRLWSPPPPPHQAVAKASCLLKTYYYCSNGGGGEGVDGSPANNTPVPTSVDFVRSDPMQMVAAYASPDASILLYDLESGKVVVRLEYDQPSDMNFMSKQINRVISHPTMPLTMTAHEDRHIRFFDNRTGKMVHSMVAHLDAVTCLAVDPNGLFLLSGSHDCSIRLWNLDNKTCVQEITSHRKKFDESIFDVAFHPSKAFIASGGGDALAKVFV